MKQKLIWAAGLTIGAILLVLLVTDGWHLGRETDQYRGVPVYDNGLLFFRSHGRHFAPDGYYFGQKWQCVEFIKRFYYTAKKHRMPEVMGHAKSFFDPDIPPGQINPARGLRQFRNGGNVAPQADDLLVFTDTRYGHVGIITAVEEDWVEIIQQNIWGKPRQRLPLKRGPQTFWIGNSKAPAGWLRQDAASAPLLGQDYYPDGGIEYTLPAGILGGGEA